MRAVVAEGPGVVVVKDVPDPVAAPEEVLVRVVTASICNMTDAHVADGTFEGYLDYYPQILGHEVHGKVVERGNDVTTLERGDRVVLYSPSGGFCEYVKFNPKTHWGNWARVGSNLPDREVSLCEMLHGAYIGMVLPAQVRETEDVLLIGQGPMGLTAAQCAALTARTVATVDIYENRVAKSREVGSDYAYDRGEMSADEILGAVRKTTGGVDVVFMCIDLDRSRESDAWDTGMRALRPGGRIATLFVSVKGEGPQPSAESLSRDDIRLASKSEGSFDAGAVFQQGVDFVAEGRIDMGALITHEVGFDGVAEALDLCRRRPDQVIKVVVWPP